MVVVMLTGVGACLYCGGEIRDRVDLREEERRREWVVRERTIVCVCVNEQRKGREGKKRDFKVRRRLQTSPGRRRSGLSDTRYTFSIRLYSMRDNCSTAAL